MLVSFGQLVPTKRVINLIHYNVTIQLLNPTVQSIKILIGAEVAELYITANKIKLILYYNIMIKTITTLAIVLCSLVASAQQFEQGMGKAMELWQQGKTTEASAMFERIAAAEPNQWLPNYYVALVNTTKAFDPVLKTQVPALLEKAQMALDKELLKDDSNAELLVLQALINTAYIVYDPMTNGMLLSDKVRQLYVKASILDPKNPRVVAGKAEFEIGGARYFGGDTKPMCAEIDRAIELFTNFKPETTFHPNWGLERALEVQKDCKK